MFNNISGILVKNLNDTSIPGLELGDVIVGLNNISIKTVDDIYLAVARNSNVIDTVDIIRLNKYIQIKR